MSLCREGAELWRAYGPPAAVIDTIQASINAGCTTPARRFVSPSLQEPLQRCLEEVMPALAI